MSDPSAETVTDIGAPMKKPFGGKRTNRPAIDTGDFAALSAAAHRLAKGSPRALMAVSLDEQRALFRMAAIGADALQRAADLIAASDAGEPPNVVAWHLERLIEFVRPLMEEPHA